MAEQMRINAQNPWPWLDPFTEDAAEFFNGRDEDADNLMRGVFASPVSVLFGKSGQGKTSLLQAGLAPRLRQEFLLPVLVRLNYGSDDSGKRQSVSSQLLKRLQDETSTHGIRWRTVEQPAIPADNECDRLWEWLHDNTGVWRDAESQRWQPVFMLDQFEEIFTLLGDDAERQRIFNELGDLLENRTPPSVVKRIREGCAPLNRIDLDSQPYRFLIALREDYLPDLEQWADLIPRLGSNRYRLQPMTRQQAQQAIAETGRALIAPEDAEQILDYLLRQNHGDRAKTRLKQARRIDPAILSLLCSGLNDERLKMTPPPDRLQLDSLEKSGERILERFYDDAFKSLAEPERNSAQHFVIHHLITDDGVRRPYPQLSASAAGLSEFALRELVQRRLLRIEADSDDERIELVHDRLASIAFERRRQAEALAKRREQEVRHKRQQRQKRLGVTLGLAMLFPVVSFSLLYLSKERQSESEKRVLAEKSALDAKRSELALAAKNQVLEQQQEELNAAQQRILAEKTDALRARTVAVQARSQAEDARVKAESATTQATEAFKQQRDATERATNEASRANAAEALAKGKVREATILRLAAESPAMTRGDSDGGPIRGLLTLLAAHQLAHGTSEMIETKTYAALQGEALRFERQVFLRTASPVRTVAFSPDGLRIASGHFDGTLRLWNAANGMPVGAPMKLHGSLVSSLAFSPDGRRIVAGSWDNTLQLWDTASGTPIGNPLNGHTNLVTSVAFSPDGRRIVSGSWDNTLRLWDAASGTPVGEPLKGHTDNVRSVAFSPDGQRIVSVGLDALWWWDAVTGAHVGEPVKKAANAVAFSPNGKHIVTGHLNKTLQIWDATSGAPIGEAMKGHTHYVNSVAYSPDGQRIVSASNDQTLRLWDATTGAPIGEPLKGHLNKVNSAAFSPDGRRGVSGSEDGTLRLWGATVAEPWRNIGSTVAFSPDGRRVAADSGSSLQQWDVSNRTPIGKPMNGHTGTIASIAFSPDGRRIVSGSHDHTLRLWDAATGSPIGEPMKGHAKSVYSVAFSPDGRRIVSGGYDHTLRMWDAATGAPIGEPMTAHTSTVNSVSFSPDGRRIISASWDKTLRLWDAATGVPIGEPMKGHTFWVRRAAFSPDGQRIVSGSWDDTLRLWNANTGAPIGEPMKGHTGDVKQVVFSPDGRYVVSGSDDRTLRLWNAATGAPIGEPLKGHTGNINSLTFSPDGKSISSTSDDGMRVWPILEGWADALCAKLDRNMSAAEWHNWISPDIDYVKQCPALSAPAN